MPGSAQNTPDVTIIGAGIVGVCCALTLLEGGQSVRVIDQHPPGEGASHGNAGVISPWSFIPQAMPGKWKQIPGWLLDPEGPLKIRINALPAMAPWAPRFLRAGSKRRVPGTVDAMSRLVATSINGYRHFLAGTRREDLLAASFYIHLLRNGQHQSLDDFVWRLRTDRGAPVEQIDAATLRDIEPDIGPSFAGAILIRDQARTTSPGELCKTLARKAASLGAEFVESPVRQIRRAADGAFQIDTVSGVLPSTRVVVAAGAWSVRLLAAFGVKLPLIAERGYHMTFEEPGVRVNHSVMDTAAHIVISSMRQGVRAAGTAEFSQPDSPADFRRAQIMVSQTRAIFPRINTTRTTPWMGVRPSFPDSLPVIGPVPGQPGMFAAFGHSHYGMSMAPGTAQLLASLMRDETPHIDASPYRMTRFQASTSPSGSA